MISIKSSELARLASETLAVAASTTEVIWELVRELERVLLVLRDETLPCLELLVEERRALSSLITAEAVDSVADAVEAELLLSLSSVFAQAETSNAMLTIKTDQENNLFIIPLKIMLKCSSRSHKFELFNPIVILSKLIISQTVP